MTTTGATLTQNSTTTFGTFQVQKLIITNISSNTVTIGGLILGVTQTLTGIIPNNSTSQGTVGAFLNSNNTFDITIGTTLNISTQWASAHVNRWIRMQQAQAYIIKKAV